MMPALCQSTTCGNWWGHKDRKSYSAAKAGESSRQPERLTRGQLESLDARISHLPAHAAEDFVQGLPKSVNIQWTQYKLKKVIEISLEEGIINKEHAQDSLAAINDVENTLLSGKKLTPEQKESLPRVMMEIGQQNHKVIGHAAALSIGERFEEIIEEEDTRGGDTGTLDTEMRRMQKYWSQYQKNYDKKITEALRDLTKILTNLDTL
jgi:hypothetical protein